MIGAGVAADDAGVWWKCRVYGAFRILLGQWPTTGSSWRRRRHGLRFYDATLWQSLKNRCFTRASGWRSAGRAVQPGDFTAGGELHQSERRTRFSSQV